MDKLPKTVKETLHICVGIQSYNKGVVEINAFDPSDIDSDRQVSIGTVDIELDVPQDVNVTAKHVAILQKKKSGIVEAYAIRLKQVDDEIKEVQALPAPPIAEHESVPF